MILSKGIDNDCIIVYNYADDRNIPWKDGTSHERRRRSAVSESPCNNESQE